MRPRVSASALQYGSFKVATKFSICAASSRRRSLPILEEYKRVRRGGELVQVHALFVELVEELLEEIGVADVVHGRVKDAVDHEARLRHAGLSRGVSDEGVLVGRHVEMLLHGAVLGVEQTFQRLLHVDALAAGQLRQRELLLAVNRRLADEIRDGQAGKLRLRTNLIQFGFSQANADIASPAVSAGCQNLSYLLAHPCATPVQGRSPGKRRRRAGFRRRAVPDGGNLTDFGGILVASSTMGVQVCVSCEVFSILPLFAWV